MKRLSVFAVLLGAICLVGPWILRSQDSSPAFTAHEWGTFTSVAGNDGRAVEWTSYQGSGELPGFVEHLSDRNLKGGLRGTLRLETPVLYFYSPRKVTLSVKVRFSQGLLTEWFPSVSHAQPGPGPLLPTLAALHTDGAIGWDRVSLEPGSPATFPVGPQANPYYAARETSAVPLVVKGPQGEQHERFLFYRGVSGVHLPLLAQVARGGEIQLANLGMGQIPAVILFERRGDQMGYHIVEAPAAKTDIDPPQLLNFTVEELRRNFEALLVRQGLFADEARAMVETWRNSWFEEGTRIFYIVPRQFVDTVLPLSIQPTPARTVRVFVGRLELITPATRTEVAAALATQDQATLDKYRRFLEPITGMICATATQAEAVLSACR
jgi:hypothetical protein